MGIGALPPVPSVSYSLGVAFVYANDQCFIFYYDQTDKRLSMGKGREGTEYTGNPIAVSPNRDYITFNLEPVPTPLAAGYDPNKKEIRVYYIKSDYTVAEIITPDFGDTWKYGGLAGSPYKLALVGGLAAYPGDLWRVIIYQQDQPGTFVELFEKSPGSWTSYTIT